MVYHCGGAKFIKAKLISSIGRKTTEQEFPEEAQEQREGSCGPIQGGKVSSFHDEHISLIRIPKSMEETDDVTTR